MYLAIGNNYENNAMASVTLKKVEKIYPGEGKNKSFLAVKSIDLEIRDGEFMVLVGPSGCAKSTTLRMIAGLEDITNGDIYIDDVRVNDLPPKKRDIAMVFQNYALYPHMTVFENMAFGLMLAKRKKKEIREKVEAAAAILGLTELLDRRPNALSGGQRQRVAVGRSIVREPKVFLLDEPLSNLDAKMRISMRAEISQLHKRLGVTMIYVTHDQTEAMTMGDRITVMDSGRIMQVATPMELYRDPANKFVAGFIGSPPMNFIEGELSSGSFREVGCEEVICTMDKIYDGSYTLGIRPEHLDILAENADGLAGIRVTVELTEPMGAETIVHTKTARGTAVVVRVTGDRDFHTGADYHLIPQADHIYCFGSDGERIEL